MTNLLMGAKIEYQQGQGFVNAQDLQVQLLIEYDKFKQKLKEQQSSTKMMSSVQSAASKQNSKNTSFQQEAARKKQPIKNNETYLPIDTILYPQSAVAAALPSGDQNKKKNSLKNQMTRQLINSIDGLKGYDKAGKQVFDLMAQKQNESLRKQVNQVHINHDRDVSPILSDNDIQSKVDQIVTKDMQHTIDQKTFSNCPPPKRSQMGISASRRSKQLESSESQIQNLMVSARGRAPLISNQRNQKMNRSLTPMSSLKSGLNVTIGHDSRIDLEKRHSYNKSSLAQFGDSETKLKQLQLQLHQMQETQQSLQDQNLKLRQ